MCLKIVSPTPKVAIMVTFLAWVPLQPNDNPNPKTVTASRPLGILRCGDTPLFHNLPVWLSTVYPMSMTRNQFHLPVCTVFPHLSLAMSSL